jgi:hypothetical protein
LTLPRQLTPEQIQRKKQIRAEIAELTGRQKALRALEAQLVASSSPTPLPTKTSQEPAQVEIPCNITTSWLDDFEPIESPQVTDPTIELSHDSRDLFNLLDEICQTPLEPNKLQVAKEVQDLERAIEIHPNPCDLICLGDDFCFHPKNSPEAQKTQNQPLPLYRKDVATQTDTEVFINIIEETKELQSDGTGPQTILGTNCKAPQSVAGNQIDSPDIHWSALCCGQNLPKPPL